MLAGVRSSAAGNLTGYSVVVVGGPIYASKPASTVQTYLNNLQPPANAKVGAFGYGSVKVDNANSADVMEKVAHLFPAATTNIQSSERLLQAIT